MRHGELEIVFPNVLPLCYESIPQLPTSFKNKKSSVPMAPGTKMKVQEQVQLQTQKEVTSRYDKLLKIVSVLKKQSYVNENPNYYPRLLCVKIKYVLPSKPKQGLVFRSSQRNHHNHNHNSNAIGAETGTAATNKSVNCLYTVSKGTVGAWDPHGV